MGIVQQAETATHQLTLTMQLYPAFAIRKVLESTLEGKAILKSLNEMQFITCKQRKLLVRLLISHLLETSGETPSSDIKKGLAMALVYEFPCLKDTTGSGYGAWYTPGRKHRPATGFLEERLRNVRKRLRKLKQGQLKPQEDHVVSKPESGLPPEKIQEMVDWMKVHKYPVSEVEGYMKETAIYRGEWIRSNGSKSILEILKEFPRLLDNPGMISQDFRRIYPEADRKLFEDWAAIADRILAYAQRDGKVHLELGDMTPDAKGESAFKVLPTLLPPSIYKTGGKVFRPTTMESRKSFIDVQPVGTNMVEYLQNAETSDVFLHILCLGDETTTSQIFSIVSGHAIETDSLLEAVDLCFKSFFVLDVNYTKQCLPTWEFLQHAVYCIDGHESSCVKFLRASVFSGHL